MSSYQPPASFPQQQEGQAGVNPSDNSNQGGVNLDIAQKKVELQKVINPLSKIS